MTECTTTEESLNRFFAVIGTELESYKRYTELYAPQLAPGFNFISCMYPDENRLSAILAQLLDPKGAHGQGPTFLRLFLEAIGFDKNWGSEFSKLFPHDVGISTSNTRVDTEVRTNLIKSELRRIDILLELDGFGIAIENKPWACDQDDQLKDYTKYLVNKFKTTGNGGNFNHLLIYLSKNGALPSKESISTKAFDRLVEIKRLQVVDFKVLIPWLEKCSEKCRAVKVRVFLEEFKRYIELNFGEVTDMEESTVVIDHILNNRSDPSSLRTAFLLAQSLESIKDRLMDELITSLNAMSSELSCAFYPDPNMRKQYAGFEWTKPEWKDFRICFTFECANFVEPIFGIGSVNSEEPMEKCEEIFKLGCDGKFDSPAWYCWKHWKSPSWGNQNELWADIYDESLPKNIMKEVERMAMILDNLQPG